MRRREHVTGLSDVPTALLEIPRRVPGEGGGVWWSRYRAWTDALQPILTARGLEQDDVRRELEHRQAVRHA